jgi:hypothetical protein
MMERLGLVAKETERSLLIVGDSVEAIDAIGPLIADLQARDSRITLLLSSADADIRARLAGNPWKLRVVTPPHGLQPAMGLFLERLNVRAIALLEPLARAPYAALLQGAARQAIAVMALSPSAIDAARTGDDILAAMARDLKALRGGGPLRPLGAGLLKLAESPRFRRAIGRRLRRLRDLEELRARLKFPRTIMCLGNGPSSEDPGLLNLPHDALFRVNHSWLPRGFLAKPDVVFTGGRPTMRAVEGAIFGLQAAGTEMRLAIARGLNPLAGCTEYFDANDLTPSLRRFDWGHLRPTNGAAMLAVAMALAPQRVIVAGIDLFKHPDGSYPGDMATANAYSPGHTRETELAFLLGLFLRYQGELTIIGDILRQEWDRYRLVQADTP